MFKYMRRPSTVWMQNNERSSFETGSNVNYRHAFHAGNFADVHKHIILIAVLDYLLQKPKPILYLDTHAGRGEYDLSSGEAERGNEWQQGIGRVLNAKFESPVLRRYQHVIRDLQSQLQ